MYTRTYIHIYIHVCININNNGYIYYMAVDGNDGSRGDVSADFQSLQQVRAL